MTEQTKFWVEVVIVVFQTVLMIFGWQIRDTVVNHENRLDAVERFQAHGDRWTLMDQSNYSSMMNQEIRDLWIAIGENRSASARNAERIALEHSRQ